MNSTIVNAQSPSAMASEPIAVVGIACRFPGDASTPERFWELLQDGESAHSKVPKDRFHVDAFYDPTSTKPNTISSQGGHFLSSNVAAFDASFFNLTATEARAMDPQQRLLLEVSYEALENAGLAIGCLSGSNTGCFVGCFTKDYSELIGRDVETSPQYTATGNSASILSNRISWFYNLKGPSMTLDTACSSSLVAVHLACQSLQLGETNMAIVGGCNLILNPDLSICLSNLHMLAKDGLSKAFDSRGDGYGRGEGIASIILKPLADAVRDGDPIRAVIRGTGVNQDGRTPGITLPNSQAQEDLIRSTYARAGLDINQTAYVEAHGTGTAAGDPLELEAIGRAFGATRPSGSEIVVGSVKTNIGHLEGAAGLAALIKSIFILENGVIPASLHFKNAHPRLQLDKWGISVPRESKAWPKHCLRRISVNSFGFGGTNAHLIIDDAGHYLASRGIDGIHNTILGDVVASTPRPESCPKLEVCKHKNCDERPRLNGHLTIEDSNNSSCAQGKQLFVLTAYDQDSVNRMKDGYARYLQDSVERLGCSEMLDRSVLHDLAFTLTSKRSRLPWKTFVIASSRRELSEKLQSAAATSKPLRSSNEPRIGFVFTGQGAQWPRMGIELMRYQSFSRSIAAAENFLLSLGCEWSVTKELHRTHDESRIHLPQFSQPICTVVQVALVDLLRSWGILPSAVVGHSSGEIAAAYCCGAMSAQDAWKIAYYRGHYASKIQIIAPHLEGSMMAVGLTEKEALDRISTLKSGKVVVAAINSPSSVTISGDRKAIEELQDRLSSEGVFTRALKVDNAYHSHHMEVIANEYRDSISATSVLTSENSTQMFSSVTGSVLSTDELGPDYWITNLVSPVRFLDAVGSLISHGKTRKRRAKAIDVDVFVELGPHPALRGPVNQILQSRAMKSLPYLSLLQRTTPDVETTLQAVGTLFTMGSLVDISLANTQQDYLRRGKCLVDLPPYPWNHSQTFWHESRISKNFRFREHACHDLLGVTAQNFNALEPQWRKFVRTSTHPWIRDHVIQDSVLYPAAGLVLMVIEAARQMADPDKRVETYCLRDVRIGKAVVLPDDDTEVECQLQIRPRKIGTRADIAPWFEFTIFTSTDGGKLVENCSGLLFIRYELGGASPSAKLEATIESQEYREKYWDKKVRSKVPEDITKFYASLDKVGLTYGPFFQAVTQISKGDSYCCSSVRVILPEIVDSDSKENSYLLHPGTLDGLFQTAFAGFGNQQDQIKEAMVPLFIQSISISSDLPTDEGSEYVGYTTSSEYGFREIISDIVMSDSNWKEPKIVIKGFQCIQISAMTGVIARAAVDSQRKIIATELSWKPDIDLLPMHQLQDIIENATAAEKGLTESVSIEQLELASFLFIARVLKRVKYSDVDIPHMKLLHKWMQTRYMSVERGEHAHKTALLDWMNLADDLTQSVIAEVYDSGPQGQTLCTIGENLEQIITGQIEPLRLLLEDELLSKFYREAKEMKYMNSMLSEYLKVLAHKNPEFSILEIGAGTGGTTHDIVSALSGGDGVPHSFSHYTFTDIGSAFCEKAENEFARYSSSMTFKVLDIEQEPQSQGFEEGKYDVVIATCVLHATRSIDEALANSRKLLKPGGKLCLIELTNPLTWTGLIFGCLPGWWSGEADGRYDGPLLPVDHWNRALKRSGLSGVDLLFQDSKVAKDQQLSLMIATLQDISEIPESPDRVVILEPATLTEVQDAVSRCLVEYISAEGVSVERTAWTADLSSCRESRCIVLIEFAAPLLHSLTEEDLHTFKNLIDIARETLWVSRGDDPRLDIVLGMSRTIRNEMNGLKLRVLRINDEMRLKTDELAKQIWDVENVDGPDMEFVFQSDAVNIGRYTEHVDMNKMIESKCGKVTPTLTTIAGSRTHLKLEIGVPGMLDTLFFVEDPEPANGLESDDVEISVRATGLNFRDVMVAMGQIPDGTLGFEVSGIVSRIGSAVKRINVGDRICTIGKGTHRTTFRSKELLCQLIPESMSFEEAASLPLISCTVFQALIRVARIRKGQSVLIHSAAGGVGQAALQIAKHYDAEIFATVGSAEKKKLIMETYGIREDHIHFSRDLSFSKGIMRMTKGRGVDIILNSLSGEALRETWHCLAPFGTFVEIGIKDILGNSGLDMLPFLRDSTFASVNLEHIGRANPALMAEILEGTFELLRSGATNVVTPLRVYPSSEIEDAFRLMQTGQHKGKIVISFSDNDIIPVAISLAQPLKMAADSTYLLVGCLGGLGRSLAKFIVKHGARNLAFISRSGASSAQQKAFLSNLQQEGLLVRVYLCDVSDAKQLQSTLSDIAEEMPQIRGVISGAMVLQDSIFQNMTHSQWTEPLRPKVSGSWNLHSLLPQELDFFILLSSQVGIYGNRGQANYAAGCTFQDALCRYRRSKGMKAVSLDLGIMLGIGYIAEAGGVDALRDWEAFGVNEGEFHCLMQAAITGYAKRDQPISPQVVIGLATGGGVDDAGIDTPYYFNNPQMAVMAKTGKNDISSGTSGSDNCLANQLGNCKTMADASRVIVEAVVTKIAKSLRTDMQNIEIDKPLHSYGVDSLVAVELRNWVIREIMAEVSLFDMMSSIPIHALAEKMASKSQLVPAAALMRRTDAVESRA